MPFIPISFTSDLSMSFASAGPEHKAYTLNRPGDEHRKLLGRLSSSQGLVHVTLRGINRASEDKREVERECAREREQERERYLE